MAIPKLAHGGNRSFYVGARVEFPDGEGGLVRHSLGRTIGELSAAGKVGRGAATLASLLLLHHASVQKPPSVEWQVPTSLRDSIPSGLGPIVTLPSPDDFIHSCPRTSANTAGCLMILLFPALVATAYVWVDQEIAVSWRIGVTSVTLLLLCVTIAQYQRDRKTDTEPHWWRL